MKVYLNNPDRTLYELIKEEIQHARESQYRKVNERGVMPERLNELQNRYLNMEKVDGEIITSISVAAEDIGEGFKVVMVLFKPYEPKESA